MKTWIRCVVLVISCALLGFLGFLDLGLFLLMAQDKQPAIYSLPILSTFLIIAAIIIFVIWCFLYTKENKRKSLGFTALILAAVSLVIIFISPIIIELLQKPIIYIK